jgi:hypothetical protein
MMPDDLFDWGAHQPQHHKAPCPVPIPFDVCSLFERLALRLLSEGWRRYSSDAILHRIRWHFRVERGIREFKCNDHWTATLSRWAMANHVELAGFFETRQARPLAEDDE